MKTNNTTKTTDLTAKLIGDKTVVAVESVRDQPSSCNTNGSTVRSAVNPITKKTVQALNRQFDDSPRPRNSLCSEIIGQTLPLTCDDLQNLSSGNVSECLPYFIRNCGALTLCAPASACVFSGMFIEASICKGKSNGNIATLYFALKTAECLMDTGGRLFCISGAAAFATPAPETSCQKLGAFSGTLFGIPACAITLNYSIPPAIALANTIAQ